MREYKHALFIGWDCFDNQNDIAYTQECADFLNWNCEVVNGSPSLLRDMLDGNWDERFAVIEPGQVVIPTYQEDIIRGEWKSDDVRIK